MNEAERDLLATRICGWHIEQSTFGPLWCDRNSLSQRNYRDWHPEQVLDQAMMLANQLRAMGWHVTLTLATNIHENRCSITWTYANTPIGIGTSYYGQADTLSEAISKAALAFAQGMQEAQL